MTDHTDVIPARAVNGAAILIAILAILLSVFALGRSLSDTGGGGGSSTAGGAGGDGQAQSVTVSLTEFAINPSTIEIAEGGTLEVLNEGSVAHNLRLKSPEMGTQDLNGGESETLSLGSLAAGSYEMFCSIPGHEAAGMRGTLIVGGAGQVAGGAEELSGLAKAEWLRSNYEASVGAFPAETSVHGNQRMEPVIQEDGSKLFELTIDEVEWEVAPGDFVEAVAYNGMIPGPWIDVEVGDFVTIRLHNELDDQATTLHPHGIFMHPFEVDGVGYVSHDPTMPGETYEVTWQIKEPSVGMYHGHDNGVHQVINGAFGLFTAGDMPLPPEADNVVGTQTMVLNDAGAIGLTLNAKSFPATEPYVLNDGEQMILHYQNEGLTAHPMHLHNNAQMVIAKDGYPLEVPYLADTINIAPGERYTVVVFAESPGVWVWHCHILSHVEKDDGSVFGMFTALIVNPSQDEADNTDRDVNNGEESTEDAPAEGDEAAADGEAAAEGEGDGG